MMRLMEAMAVVCVVSGFCEDAYLFKIKDESGYHMVAQNAHVFGKSDEYWQGLAEDNGVEFYELEVLGECACPVQGLLGMAATIASQWAAYAAVSDLKNRGSNVSFGNNCLHALALIHGLKPWVHAAQGTGDLSPGVSLFMIGIAILEAGLMKKNTSARFSELCTQPE